MTLCTECSWLFGRRPQGADQLQPPVTPISHLYQHLETVLPSRCIQQNELIQSDAVRTMRTLNQPRSCQAFQSGFNRALAVTEEAHNVCGTGDSCAMTMQKGQDIQFGNGR